MSCIRALVSAPYVIVCSTKELYTCLFSQMARLLLNISRCLAFAAQPAMILRCISLFWFFSLRLYSLCTVTKLSEYVYIFQDFYVHIFDSLFLYTTIMFNSFVVFIMLLAFKHTHLIPDSDVFLCIPVHRLSSCTFFSLL